MKLKVNAPLDPGFMPMAVVYRDFEAAVAKEGGQKLTIGLERNDGLTSVYTVDVFKDGTGHDEENHEFVERLVKTLLWTRGGYKIIIAGSKVRMVLEAAGIHNIRAKCLRSNNPINVVKATLAGLSELRTVEQVANTRGITADDVKGGTQK